MGLPVIFLLPFLLLLPPPSAQKPLSFSFEGFSAADPRLLVDGDASVTPEGLLRLTTPRTHVVGHAFFRTPIAAASGDPSALSFSAAFVFAIAPTFGNLGGNGIALALGATTNYSRATGSQYLGLVNSSADGSPANRLVFVELDTIFNPEINDTDDNHVGIDVNSVRSVAHAHAGYYDGGAGFRNLTLIDGDPIQVWVDYNSSSLKLDVTLAPANTTRPRQPLLSHPVNLSAVVGEIIYVGFSSSTGSFPTTHYILGWSFQSGGGEAKPLNISALPKLPAASGPRSSGTLRAVVISAASVLLLAAVLAGAAFVVARRIKFAELVEDWEAEYGSRRFAYRDLYRATGGFSENRVLGSGGFGRVYRGVLPGSKAAVAVKRVAHESRQGTKEFVAELASLGQLRHRNLVQLLGYSRRRRELLLVYELMPNGSLDRLLFSGGLAPTWRQRLHIVRGVAAALCYLHEEWGKVVVHRDVKASNVLVDGGMNGKLGDFGLARLYDHGGDPHTTHVVGTVGYLAPELARTGRATKATDVYAFGVLVLETVTGRRAADGEVGLVEWVAGRWRAGGAAEVADGRMGGVWAEEEVGRAVGVGLSCCHPVAGLRPGIQQVVAELGGEKEAKVEVEERTLLAAMRQQEMVEEKLTEEPSLFVTSSVLWAGR